MLSPNTYARRSDGLAPMSTAPPRLLSSQTPPPTMLGHGGWLTALVQTSFLAPSPMVGLACCALLAAVYGTRRTWPPPWWASRRV
jgi:hypothetical protein